MEGSLPFGTDKEARGEPAQEISKKGDLKQIQNLHP